MERLSEREWRQFDFPEIFDIKKGFYNKKPNSDGTGTIPFLGATDSNNGVTRFLTLDEIKRGTNCFRVMQLRLQIMDLLDMRFIKQRNLLVRTTLIHCTCVTMRCHEKRLIF